MRKIITVTTAVALAVIGTPANATDAPVFSGTGWKIMKSNAGIQSLSNRTMTIKFASTTARDKLTPYLKPVASQLTSVTGTKFNVSTTITPMPSGCAKLGEIIVSLTYRPTGVKSGGTAGPCYYTPDHSVHSGRAWMDSEWLYKGWFSTNSTTNSRRVKNALAHEIGHTIGLSHPNYDRDHDGSAENYECVTDSKGYRPLICSPNGGYMDSRAGQFTAYDIAGLKALKANYTRPVAQF